MAPNYHLNQCWLKIFSINSGLSRVVSLKAPNPRSKSALIRTVACWKTGNKPLPEPVLTPLIDVFIPHQTSESSQSKGRFQACQYAIQGWHFGTSWNPRLGIQTSPIQIFRHFCFIILYFDGTGSVMDYCCLCWLIDPLMTPVGDGYIGQQWLRWWLVVW